MELLQLKYFIESVKTLNFSHTAKKFSVPPSAVSQSIKRLETELGTALFNRSNNKIVPTECGKILYNQVSISLSALEDGLNDLKLFNSAIAGNLSILIESNRSFLIACITKFKSLHPHLEFNISHRRHSNDTTDFDIIISDTQISDKRYERVPLIRERILLAVSKSHSLANETSVKLSRLKNEPIISMHSGSSLHSILLDIFKPTGFLPNITIFCDDPNYTRLYTSLGFGICLFPEISWKDNLNENIVLLPFEPLPHERITYLYYKPKNKNNIAALFKEFIVINAEENHLTK